MLSHNSQQSEIQKYKRVLRLTPEVVTKNKNSYQLCKRQTKINDNQWPCEFILKNIKNITVTATIKQRLNQLHKLKQIQNLASIKAKGYSQAKKDVSILSQYFYESQSLRQIIESKQEYQSGILNRICYQVIYAMVKLQQSQINHLRLNPSSILIKFKNNSDKFEDPIVQICDLGVYNQSHYVEKYLLHKDIFNGTDPYQNSYENNIKYDLWAFGCILYQTIKLRKPFYSKISMFHQSIQFKVENLTNPQKWLKQNNNDIGGQFLVQRVILKCWQVKGYSKFKNWKNVLDYFLQSYSTLKYETYSINEISNNHLRLMFLFLKIYNLIAEQLQFKVTRLLNSINSEETEKKLKKINIFIFKICQNFHNVLFQKYFRNRCSTLPYYKRLMLSNIGTALSNERDQLSKINDKDKVQTEFTIQQLIQNTAQGQYSFKTICDKNPECYKNGTIIILKNFLLQLIKFKQKCTEVMKQSKKNLSEILLLFYESPGFVKMAQSDFGFFIPEDQLFRRK